MLEVLRTLWPYLRRQRKALAIIAVAMLGEVSTELLTPWPLKFVFDNVLFVKDHTGGRRLRHGLSSHAVRVLALTALAALAIAVVDAVCSYVDTKGSEVVSQRAVFALRGRLFAHLQRLSLAFHTDLDTRVGDLLSRMSGDIQSLQDLAAGGVSNLVTNGLTLGIAVVVMLVLDWQLALLSIVLTVPLYVLTRRNTLQMRSALRRARRQEGRVSAVLQEALSSIKLVQAYGREDYESQRLSGASSASLQASLEAATLQSRISPTITVLSTIATWSVTAAAVAQVLNRTISPGEMLIFLSYQRGMATPIRQLSKLSYVVGKAAAGVERINETFAHEPAVQSRAWAAPLERPRGAVSFRDVRFRYTADREVLRGVSLDVAAGQVVAVVGQTGSGKSTLLSLLPRFYDPHEGSVSIDGVDVRDVTVDSLRAQIALVLQDSLIFRASIRDNIAYGRPDASDADIEAAGRAAGVDRIVARFPDGYDAVVSERGASLSGGEKQCVGIARALLKDAGIVVLDEPTSAMDSLTEELVMGGLRTLLAGRTAFVIAHRFATIRDADLVVVMHDGQIVEAGAPEHLLAHGTWFRDLADSQGFTLVTP